MPEGCGTGKILRKGYTRKSYNKKSKHGSIKISQSRVEPTCIKDIGSKGHGPKILPKPDPNMSLGKYGYSLSRNVSDRRKSLKKASKKIGTLNVLRRTNLIRNYSKSVKNNYKKLSDDVEYLKREYSKEKKNKK
jgi:hypothetical protein